MRRKVYQMVTVVLVLAMLPVGETSVCLEHCQAQTIIARPKKKTEPKKSTPKKNSGQTAKPKTSKGNAGNAVPKIDWGATREILREPEPREEQQVIEEPKVAEPEPSVKKEEPKEKVFQTVEQMPQFPGGDAALFKWLSEHIKYPAMAQEEGAQGRVLVQFIVTKTGSIEDVKVLRGKHPALDKEAVRVVKSMPKWIPGRLNGEPVNVTYTLPITFRLNY